LLQEFNIEIRDKKGSKNVVADHLSRLTVDFIEDVVPIAKMFPDEQLMHISQTPAPWFADIVNYLVTGQMPSHWTKHDRSKFLAELKHYFWDDPYLFKYCPDQIIRDVFLRVTRKMSSHFAMIMHVEATLVLKRLL
jgi:hypothetical protein